MLWKGGGDRAKRMKVGVIQFPGSNCDRDALWAVNELTGGAGVMIWHKETSLKGFDAILLPGGFSYGDYLRCGAIARFSPVMREVVSFAREGGPVLGICNGFQILCEAGLLPGALIRNDCLEFRCQLVDLEVEGSNAYFNHGRLGDRLRLPIAHGEGNYRADERTLQELEDHRQVLFRYGDPAGNPNGSVNGIAGIRNRLGNVVGMMPHPERAVDRLHESQDGRKVLEAFLEQKAVAR